ncbi:MAG: hypothetical protein JOZ99_04950 [Actinobacteria bacterium]|nr:hypothetical protein [Actinomycetota bacterium]
MTINWTKKPRFNHVAMSVPSQLLDADGRKLLTDFYREVFGWEELPTETVDGKKLVFGAYQIDQFVFLIADDEPMTCPRLDHYGIAVYSEDDLDGILERAKSYRDRDDRVDIIDKKVDDHGMLSITSCYIRYLLPMMVEVQWWQFADPRPQGVGA